MSRLLGVMLLGSVAFYVTFVFCAKAMNPQL